MVAFSTLKVLSFSLVFGASLLLSGCAITADDDPQLTPKEQLMAGSATMTPSNSTASVYNQAPFAKSV